MSTPLRLLIGAPADELFLVEDEERGIHIAFQPSDPFTTEELGATGVCVASPDSARDDLVALGGVVSDAIRLLDERRRRELSS